MTSFGILQYSIECDSCACSGVCPFYCNSCYISLCEKCKDEHLTNSLKKFHDVVLYRQRVRRLQMDKCRYHPMKIADICCKECEVPVCSNCTTTPQHRVIPLQIQKRYAQKGFIFIKRNYRIFTNTISLSSKKLKNRQKQILKIWKQFQLIFEIQCMKKIKI